MCADQLKWTAVQRTSGVGEAIAGSGASERMRLGSSTSSGAGGTTHRAVERRTDTVLGASGAVTLPLLSAQLPAHAMRSAIGRRGGATVVVGLVVVVIVFADVGVVPCCAFAVVAVVAAVATVAAAAVLFAKLIPNS